MKKFAILVLAFALMILPMAAMADTYIAVQLPNANDGVITLSNQFTFTDGSKYVIESDSPVTIVTNGVVDAFEVSNGSTLRLGKNIKITSNTAILYANGGTIIIDGAEVVREDTTPYGAAVAANGGVIEVKSGSIKGLNSRVALDVTDGGKAIISGGEVSSEKTSAIAVRGSNSSLEIKGGTIKTTSALKDGDGNYYVAVYANNGGKVNMTGGTVSSANSHGLDADVKGTVTISGGTVKGNVAVYAHDDAGTTMTITGGTFSDDSALNYLQAGLTLKQKNGMFTVSKISTGSLPSTGDNSSLMLWSALMVLACAGFVASRKLRHE